MRRLVLDTTIIIAGLRSQHEASSVLLEMIGRGRIVPLATTGLFFEYEAVIKRPEHLAASGLTLELADRFLRALASSVEPVSIRYVLRPQLSDPADEKVLEAAVNGGADALVTYNVRDFGPASRFGIPVLRPRAVIARIEA